LKYLIALFFALLPLFGGAQTAQAQSAQVDCKVNPSACQAAPTPSTCPTGKHWTLMGNGIAHCVLNDPVCPAGTTELTHDWLGNPSCFVLIISYEDRSKSCPSGTDGTWEQQRKVTTHADGTKTYGSWTTTYKDCAAPPAPPEPTTCSNGASDYPTCTTPTTPPPGVCTNGGTDYPTCTAPSTPTTPTDPQTGVCSNGANDYPTCTPPTTTPAVCSNGAKDYPTCTPPPPPTCPNGAKNYPTCTIEAPQVTCWDEVKAYDNGPGAVCGKRGYQVCSDGTRIEIYDVTGFHDWNGQCLYN
jgi:hypothetical protein